MSFIGTAIGIGALGGSALIAGGGAIAGSLISANASRSAAGTAANAQQQAAQTQLDMYNRTRSDLAPWMQGGGQGLNALLGYLGISGGGFDPNAPGVRPFGVSDFQTDPGYQFRLNEGLNAILNKRSALGGINSGGTLRDLTSYGQGLASQEYGNAFNRYRQGQTDVYGRLSGLADIGQSSAAGVGTLGSRAAGLAGEFQGGAGNALAAGQFGQAAAWNQGIQGLGNQWLQANALQQRPAVNNTAGNLASSLYSDPYYGYGYASPL